MSLPADPEFPVVSRESLPRRRFIAGVGAAAGAAAFGLAPRAEAAVWPRSSRRVIDLRDLDADWVRRQESELRAYVRFLEGLQLRNIGTDQVIRAHAKRRGSVWNSLPPRAYWRCVGPTLQVVDRVSRELDVPVTEVVSVYRTPSYNARCPGARSGSWHIRNFAVDVKMGAKPSVVATTTRRLRDRGLFRGGVGSYWGFTHVDTRGTNVDW